MKQCIENNKHFERILKILLKILKVLEILIKFLKN